MVQDRKVDKHAPPAVGGLLIVLTSFTLRMFSIGLTLPFQADGQSNRRTYEQTDTVDPDSTYSEGINNECVLNSFSQTQAAKICVFLQVWCHIAWHCEVHWYV